MHLHLRQSQQLVLTPQMQQSLKLLSLSSVEMLDFVQQIVLENPFLEQAGSEDSFSQVSEDGQKGDNLENYDVDQWQQYWREFKSSKRTGSDSTLSFEERIYLPMTLKDHLRGQLHQETSNPEERLIGDYLIDLVQEDGYIRQDMEGVAADLDCPLHDVLSVLTMLQRFDPVGVCARSLGECLLIQCRDQQKTTASYEKILENLNDLLEKGPEGFAKQHQIPVSLLKEVLDDIKLLNPKPGYAFAPQDSTQYVVPDVVVGRDKEGNWMCQLNESVFPRVMIDHHSYLSLMKGKRSQKMAVPDRNYINTHISNANGLLRNLRMRALTILNVAQAIIESQKESLTLGRSVLKPLTLKEIAQQLEIHESTVSRAVTGKYIAMPFGIIELKEFFGSGRSADKDQDSESTVVSLEERDGGKKEVSNKAVQYEIKIMLETENKKNPLSDEQIVGCLKEKGILVARRTVAKYREELNIPSSFERKKLSKILIF